MGPIRKAAAPYGRDALALVNRPCTLRQHRRDKPKMTVNADKTGVLYEDLYASHPAALNSDQFAGRNR